MELSEESKIRWDEEDQRKLDIEAEKAAGSGMTRVVWRERVVRMVSLEGRTVAMCVPSGLGTEWTEAASCQKAEADH